VFSLRDAKDSIERLRALADASSMERRARLVEPRFTIVSNDCWGAEVYKDLRLPYATPLVGTMIAAPCYMTLIADCASILSSRLRFTGVSRHPFVQALRKKRWFPTGVLDCDVEIQFLDYDSIIDARAKWDRRLARVDYDRLFFKLSGDKDLFTDRDLRVFDALPLARKIAFSANPHPELATVVTIPDYLLDGKSMYARTLPHFDVVAWLNEGGDVRSAESA
jgi:uncharacterized protein (DUF1919 family)